MFSQVFTSVITELMGWIIILMLGGFGSFCSWIFWKNSKDIKSIRETVSVIENKLITHEMKSKLTFKHLLHIFCKHYEEQGWASILDKTDLEDMMKVYAGMGGNGVLKKRVEAIIDSKFPTTEESACAIKKKVKRYVNKSSKSDREILEAFDRFRLQNSELQEQ